MPSKASVHRSPAFVNTQCVPACPMLGQAVALVPLLSELPVHGPAVWPTRSHHAVGSTSSQILQPAHWTHLPCRVLWPAQSGGVMYRGRVVSYRRASTKSGRETDGKGTHLVQYDCDGQMEQLYLAAGGRRGTSCVTGGRPGQRGWDQTSSQKWD